MEGTGFGLSVIAEVRTLVNSAKTRIANIRNGPTIFKGLTDDLNRLMRHIVDVETHLQSASAPIPARIRAMFHESVSSVRDILNHCNSTLDTLRSTAFPGSSSRMTARFRTLFRRTIRAKAISNTMNDLQPQLHRASNQLLILMSTLATGLTIQDVIIPKLDSLEDTGNVEEVYRVGSSTPALPQGATLNFTGKDADGKHCTPEGVLKHSILSSESSATVTAAAGVITPAHGIVGMTGVGKTIALHGLAFDKDICIRFPDGVQYISLGQGATSPIAIGEVAKIMRLTGASASVSAVERSSSLREAVDYAVAWFGGKICLFLVDDLWPTTDCETGFLNDLRQLLRSCSESRMAITTRSTAIADASGQTVDFAPRAPLGPVSLSIFMMHATRDATKKAPREPTGDLRKSIVTILTICAGLPIALAVTGSTVAFLAKEKEDFEGACDVYASQLKKQRLEIGEKKVPGGASLNAGIALSLKILESEYVKLNAVDSLFIDHSIADFYTSLCVLRNQAWVPISVLCRLWKVDDNFALAVVRLFSGLSLCKLTFRQNAQQQTKEGGLMLHDLQLDFCKGQAEMMKTSVLWHVRLLQGYLEEVPPAVEDSLSDEKGDSFEHALLTHTPRPWWSVPNDGYIHLNLARHLVSANICVELAALLLDARWTHVRFAIGGILSLKSDFEYLVTLGGDVFPLRVSREFELIWKAIQVSWGRVSEGKRSFLLQVYGRLFILRTDSAVVRSYLKSVEAHTPVPYLVPVTPFFPDPRSAQTMEIPVRDKCETVDCSPCGLFIAAGAGNDVVVADASTGDILKRLTTHSAGVTCVTFAGVSKRIVSGSRDNSVAVWEWEKSESPAHVLEGHNERVTGVAVCSDGSKIFSSSRDCTLRIWDANTGTQTREFLQKTDVYCVSVSNNDQFVAIGLRDGTLKVLNYGTGCTLFEDSNAHENMIRSVAFSASDKLLATGSWDQTIRVWDTTMWTCVGEPFQGHTNCVTCVTFSPVGQQNLIASGSFDHTVRLWDGNTGRNIWTSSDMLSDVTNVAFTPDGERSVSGSTDGNIRICDTRVEVKATEREYGHSAIVLAVAISHDGLRVASGSRDGTVRLWDSCTGKQIGRPMEGHTDDVNCVSFSLDRRHLVSGSDDRTVRRWEAETSNQTGAPLEGHAGFVYCVSFSSDGQRILSGSGDKTVRIWDAKSGFLIGDALLGHTRKVMAVSESGDGSYVVSQDSTGSVIIWNRANQTIVFQSTRLIESESEFSTKYDSETRLEMTREEAENVIRSCGQETPHLWPASFSPYTTKVYCRHLSVYSNIPIDDTFLLTLPSPVYSWSYNEMKSLFVAGLHSGAVAICNLKM